VNDEANSEGSFYLDLNINSTPSGVDPIDELQELFDAWLVDHDGDHNNDGFVDGADFLKWQGGESRNPLSSSDLAEWQANFGAMPSGDFDDDVDVVGADFLYWQLNDGSESSLDHWQATFGDVASSITAASTGVPEPTTGLMLMLGMAALMFRRHLEA
jgi:hypothetical protein